MGCVETSIARFPREQKRGSNCTIAMARRRSAAPDKGVEAEPMCLIRNELKNALRLQKSYLATFPQTQDTEGTAEQDLETGK